MAYSITPGKGQQRENEHKVAPTSGATDLVCFSHLRWGFVWQRPQHLLSRFAKFARVFVVEEPVFVEPDQAPFLVEEKAAGVTVLTPHLPEQPDVQGGFNRGTNHQIRMLIGPFLASRNVS